MKGRRHRLWWTGNGDDVVGVEAMVKEELGEKMAEVSSVRDAVMTAVVGFEEDAPNLTCGYDPQRGSFEENKHFCDEQRYK